MSNINIKRTSNNAQSKVRKTFFIYFYNETTSQP